MVFLVIRGNKLDDYVLKTKACPDVFITEGADRRINRAFEDWVTMDQLLLGWLYNMMSTKVASQVLGPKTSQELWNAVKELLQTQTRSRITLYKGELQRLKKGNLKMDEYLRKIKELACNLLLVGSQIPIDDLITQTLAGLDAKYNHVVVQLAEKTNLTWVELQASLLTLESRLEQLSSMSYSQPTAILAMNKQKSSFGNNQGWRAQQNR